MSYRYTSAPERRDRLTQFIAEQGYCTILELSREFGVSEMTVRRDVAKLANDGRVRAFRGAVGSPARTDLSGSDYRSRDITMHEQKMAIAGRAVSTVVPGAVIAVDAGTTAKEFAALLPVDHDLRVVTHSLPVVETLIGNVGVEVLCLGGTLHPESLSFDGPTTLAGIDSVRVNTLFLAASAISERGAFNGNGHDAIVKRALIEVSEQVILLADSSKWSGASTVKVCDWSVIDHLVSDDGMTEEQRHSVEQQGVEVSVVQVPVALPTASSA